jgi:hypothetical protein
MPRPYFVAVIAINFVKFLYFFKHKCLCSQLFIHVMVAVKQIKPIFGCTTNNNACQLNLDKLII